MAEEERNQVEVQKLTTVGDIHYIYTMAGAYYEQRIHKALQNGDVNLLQLRLSAMADRDIALALDGLLKEDAENIVALLPRAKAQRVRQEGEYLGRTRVTASQRRLMAERLADAMEGRRGDSGGTWIAPGQRRKR